MIFIKIYLQVYNVLHARNADIPSFISCTIYPPQSIAVDIPGGPLLPVNVTLESTQHGWGGLGYIFIHCENSTSLELRI